MTSTYYPEWFFYYWIHQHLPGFRHIAAGKATTMGHIQRHHLSEAKVAIPDERLLGAADEIFAPMIAQIVQRRLESRALGTLRDTLLPKLISGELRVNDVERFVGERA